MTPAAVGLEVYTRQRREDQQFVLPGELTASEKLRAAIENPRRAAVARAAERRTAA